MSKSNQLLPQEAIAAVQRLLDRFKNEGVVIGGVAVSMYVAPRTTARREQGRVGQRDGGYE